MDRAIPQELLVRIKEHERWLQSGHKEGQPFVERDVDLSEVNLLGCDLSDIRLFRSRFDGALLRDADLSDSSLHEVSFVRAILDDARLIKTDATRSNWHEASLRQVDAVSVEMMKADLSHADLRGANFYNADLRETNLEGANFSGADLRHAYFVNAHMAHAILTGSRLGGVMLGGVTGLESAETDWIDIGTEEGKSRRLDGAAAREWLLAEAAKE